jgi:hypothetical protein
MANLLEQAISTDDGSHAAKIIQSALGVERDVVANYCFRERGRRIVSNALGSSVIG